MRQRGFEILPKYLDQGVKIPVRTTACSAGYDISLLEDTLLQAGEMSIVPTGLRAYMQENEYLGIYIRSSLAIKRKISLANGQAIIDSDYYGNPNNGGHILLALYNFGREEVLLQAGTRVAQGIFYSYLKVDNDRSAVSRLGGIGSTD